MVQATISIALGYNVISNYNFYRCRRLPSALGAAVCAEQKMDKKASFVVSRSDCYVFPFFDLHKREPRRGSVFAVAFFCLLFFADAKKSE